MMSRLKCDQTGRGTDSGEACAGWAKDPVTYASSFCMSHRLKARASPRVNAVSGIACPTAFTARRANAREIRKRMARQMDPGEKKARADRIVDNNGDLAALEIQARRLWAEWVDSGEEQS